MHAFIYGLLDGTQNKIKNKKKNVCNNLKILKSFYPKCWNYSVAEALSNLFKQKKKLYKDFHVKVNKGIFFSFFQDKDICNWARIYYYDGKTKMSTINMKKKNTIYRVSMH